MNAAGPTLRLLHGFRFSAIDAAVLAITAVASVALYKADIAVWWMLPLVVGHFFLFCNVFRVRRNRELLWGLCLLINASWWMTQFRFDWLPTTFTQTPITLMVIILELRSPNYHGIFAKYLNPQLPAYLRHRLSAPQRGETPKPWASDAGAQPPVTAAKLNKP